MRRSSVIRRLGVPLAAVLATLPGLAAAAPAESTPAEAAPAAGGEPGADAPADAPADTGDTAPSPPDETDRGYEAPTQVEGDTAPDAATESEGAEPPAAGEASQEDDETGPLPTDAELLGEEAETLEAPEEEFDDELAGLLDEVVVGGASRTAEAGTDAPATVQVITATELKTYGIRFLDEALNYLSVGIVTESSGNTGETGVRGVTITSDFGSHMLLVMDGHVVNDVGSGIAWVDRLSGIAIDTIDRIEVIYGPGGVLYGNNAITVVINIVTKKGGDVAGLQVRLDGAMSPNQNRYGTIEAFDRKRIGHRERVGLRYGRNFKFRNRDGEILLQGDFLADKTPAWELGPQSHPEFPDIFDFGDTGSGDPTIWGGRGAGRTRGPFAYGKLRLGNFTLSGRSVWLGIEDPTAGLSFGDGFVAHQGSSYVDARYDYVVSKKVSGMVRLYGDHLLYNQQLEFAGQLFCGTITAPCSLYIGSESMGLGLENQWNFDWLGDGRFLTLLGADGRARAFAVRVKNIDSAGNEFWFEDDSQTTVDGTVGAYLQQILRVHPKVSINGGARYDYFTYAQAISPRGALVFAPWQGGSLKLFYSQAFRAPSRTELSAVVNDGDLEPEVVRSLELSLGQRKGTHHVSVAAYAGVWEDLIQRFFVSDPNNPGRIELLHRNANMLWHLGGSVGYDASLGKFSYGIGANYGWARVRLGGWKGGDVEFTEQELTDLGYSQAATDRFGRNIPLTASPPYSGNVRLAYSIGDQLPTIGFTGQLIGPRFIADVYSKPQLLDLVDDGAKAKIPPKFTGRVVLTHDITRFQWGWLGYRFGVEATTNTQTPNPIGPFLGYSLDNNQTRTIELTQVPRMTVFAGLTLGFDRKKERE